METKKVVIGIVAKHYKEQKSTRLETYIRDEVEQAIFDNGAIAIAILPPNEDKIAGSNQQPDQLTTKEKHDLYEQIALCDGIILQGGGFVDAYETFIAKYCYEYDIPVLGICAGKHCLVRGAGGKRGTLSTQEHNKQDAYVHPITIDPNSKFYSIVKCEEMMVNSRHVGYSTDLGNLTCVAVSPDLVDEVVEDASKTFYIGVQFHPESLYKRDEHMRQIFISFIQESGKKHGKNIRRTEC